MEQEYILEYVPQPQRVGALHRHQRHVVRLAPKGQRLGVQRRGGRGRLFARGRAPAAVEQGPPATRRRLERAEEGGEVRAGMVEVDEEGEEGVVQEGHAVESGAAEGVGRGGRGGGGGGRGLRRVGVHQLHGAQDGADVQPARRLLHPEQGPVRVGGIGGLAAGAVAAREVEPHGAVRPLAAAEGEELGDGGAEHEGVRAEDDIVRPVLEEERAVLPRHLDLVPVVG